MRSVLFGTMLAAVAFAAPATAAIIDNFNTPNAAAEPSAANCAVVAGAGGQCTFLNGPSQSQSNTFVGSSSDIIGSDRLLGSTSLANGLLYANGTTYTAASPATLSAQISISLSGQNAFTHSQDSGFAGYSFVVWTPDTAEERDLTDGGTSLGFLLGLLDADATVGWGLAIRDGANNTDSFYFPNPTVITPGSPGTLFVDFDNFSGVNLTNVTQIAFVANVAPIGSGICQAGGGGSAVAFGGDVALGLVGGTAGGDTFCSRIDFDTTVDFIQTVPEPATLALFGLGVLGLGAAGLRRRKTS
jgi:hypothetical protein